MMKENVAYLILSACKAYCNDFNSLEPFDAIFKNDDISLEYRFNVFYLMLDLPNFKI